MDNKLEILQKVINEVANETYAIKYGLPKNSFYITLSPKMLSKRGESVRVERGYPTAMIYMGYLPIPSQEKEFKQSLFSALDLIKKHHLYQCTEIIPVSYLKSLKKDRKKWRMENGFLDTDELPDLLPKYRLSVHSVTTMTMTDNVTGESVIVNSDMEKEFKTSRSLYDEARSRLSAIVIPNVEDDNDEV